MDETLLTYRHGTGEITRLRLLVRGAVQGVGFRPCVYRLANELHLQGWVLNSPRGVIIEVEGTRAEVESFTNRLATDRPPRAVIQSLESTWLDPAGYTSFLIRESEQEGDPVTIVVPDIGICPDCLRELSDPENRRYRYPFTNCTNCGPRYSIIESLPYDRPNTSMKHFTMCPACAREYNDPADRRFHAQPNACPDCGPQVELWDATGIVLASRESAVEEAVKAIRAGKILALKGIGGFQLLVDATNEEAVRRLRQRKHREEKPFALMFPEIDGVRKECCVNDTESRLLFSAEAPIVLLRRQAAGSRSAVSPSVAPGNPYLGVMLPYSPLHQIVLHDVARPVVATSGNLSDEPICIDERNALVRLSGIPDLYLVHNRPILRHVDDSIVRLIGGREMVLRRARGYAPLPVRLDTAGMPTTLAVGGHLKNTVALSVGDGAVVSQHIGDLESRESFVAFKNVTESLSHLYSVKPERIVADLHPSYLSRQYADNQSIPAEYIQHHYAHIGSCMAENEISGEVLGVSWDGTGYGTDGTIWGGEFLRTTDSSFTRAATFHPFLLPGNERAIHEPRRTALGVLYDALGDECFSMSELPPVKACTAEELVLFRTMLRNKLNSPLTSSAGRMFDAMASITGIRQISTFEGQAAMELEYAIDGHATERSYEFRLNPSTSHSSRPETSDREPHIIIDWHPLILEVIEDIRRGIGTPVIAGKFHNTLAEIILAVAVEAGLPRVVLSGGCFQNKYLVERTIETLREEGFQVYWHQRIPPNDGGIALGQLWASARNRQSRMNS